MPNHFIDVDGKTYYLTFERRITGSQRQVVVTAFDDTGAAVAIQDVSTASAKGYLDRDTEAAAATWEELEATAADLLRIQLEE